MLVGLFQSFRIVLLQSVLEDRDAFFLLAHKLVGGLGVGHQKTFHDPAILRHERTTHGDRRHRVVRGFEVVEIAKLVQPHSQRFAELRVGNPRGIERLVVSPTSRFAPPPACKTVTLSRGIFHSRSNRVTARSLPPPKPTIPIFFPIRSAGWRISFAVTRLNGNLFNDPPTITISAPRMTARTCPAAST